MANPARLTQYQLVHYLRRNITFADTGVVLALGTIPAGSVILKPISGVNVTTVFNAATNNFMDIGTAATGDLYGTDLSLLALGFIPLDEAVNYYVAVDTDLTATIQLSGGSQTTGAAVVIIAYIPNNDR